MRAENCMACPREQPVISKLTVTQAVVEPGLMNV
jgi:hypothetical protein